jgi:hypothetical protein
MEKLNAALKASSEVNQQYEQALKEFTDIEKVQEVQKAKHQKEEIHIEQVEEQVVQVINIVEDQEIIIEASGNDEKAVSP